MKMHGEVKAGAAPRCNRPTKPLVHMAIPGRYSESFKCKVLDLVDGGMKITIAASIQHVSLGTVNNWIRSRYEQRANSR